MNILSVPPSILFIIGMILFGLTFKHRIKQEQKNKQDRLNDFFAQELQASYVRKKEVPDTFFLTINFTYFTQHPDEELSMLYQQILSFQNRRICHLNNYTNLELKQQFGPSTFDELITYEQNYFEFMDISCKYGNILLEKGYTKEAERLFEYLLTLQCDLTSCYTALIKIYEEAHDNDKLQKLKKQLEIQAASTPYLKKVLNQITAITK